MDGGIGRRSRVQKPGAGDLTWPAATTPSPLPGRRPTGHRRLTRRLATYRVEECWLWLTFEARTSRPTLVSLSAHPYFNLAGADSGCVLDHVVTLPAEDFLPTVRRFAARAFDRTSGCVLEIHSTHPDCSCISAISCMVPSQAAVESIGNPPLWHSSPRDFRTRRTTRASPRACCVPMRRIGNASVIALVSQQRFNNC